MIDPQGPRLRRFSHVHNPSCRVIDGNIMALMTVSDRGRSLTHLHSTNVLVEIHSKRWSTHAFTAQVAQDVVRNPVTAVCVGSIRGYGYGVYFDVEQRSRLLCVSAGPDKIHQW